MLKNRLRSFKYAFKGIASLWRWQPNMRVHLSLALIALLLGVYFSLSMAEWCFIALAIALVLAAEALNSALEYLTDLISPGQHELAGRAKDAAAAGVLFAAIGAAAVGIVIFLPRILALFF